MATITATTYRSDDNGATWYSRPDGTASYINQKGYTNQTCFSFNYTPPIGEKLTQLVFTCSIMFESGSWTGTWTAELHASNLPDGNVIATASTSQYVTYTQYTDVVFTLDVPAHLSSASGIDLCIAVYGPFSMGYNGRIEVTEKEGAIVPIGDGTVYNEYLVCIADTLIPNNTNNHASFSLYIPYIGNGTSWELMNYIKEVYLYNNGDECTDISGGFSSEALRPAGYYGSSVLYPTLSKGATSMSVSIPQYYYGAVFSGNAFSVTDFNTITIKYSSNNGGVTLGITTSKAHYYSIAKSASLSGTSGTATIDISSLSGNYYFVASLSGNDGNNSITINEIVMS